MMLQLCPSIPVETPKGKGQATIIIDYSPEHDFYWVVFLDESRECWTFSNKDIRAQPNFTIGRGAFPQPQPRSMAMGQPMAAPAMASAGPLNGNQTPTLPASPAVNSMTTGNSQFGHSQPV